ncbi:ATP-binding cassette domain-containing protein [Frateuria defendens]|uniref:phosphatase domain-containing putative toxin n=1 Tax=Frateuria defendens TaxID=2219559 RepID=UPI00066FF9AF|nr:ATP-binding cassette domain-containing protein [Frateuria defendens]
MEPAVLFPSDHRPDTPPPLLALHGFGVAFGQRTVLAEIDLDIGTPGVVVLMGPSGTGKSTLLHALAGLHASPLKRQWGQARYLGEALEDGAPAPSLVHQQPRDLGTSVFEGFASVLRGRQSANPHALRRHIVERLEAFGLDVLAQRLDALPIDLPTVQARLAAIMRAAFTGSPLLLIDEPTAGLSGDDAAKILRLIRRLAGDHGCLVVLHHQRQARELADRAILMAGGRIQVDAGAADFFANRDGHPVLAQFLRTGSCHVPAPDATQDELAEDVPPPAPLPAYASAALAAPQVSPLSDVPASAPASPAAPASASASPPHTAAPDVRGPTGFHWLVPGQLAGCPMPGVVAPLDHDLALLRAMGVTLLINLTERELPAEALARHRLRSYGLTIEDRRAPPLLWAKLLLVKMKAFIREGEVLAVHCLAGLGRTGTILGAWLIREGLTADEALRRLRVVEPGFVQTQEQEDLLHALETNLLIRAAP